MADITLTRTTIRPNANVAWFQTPSAVLDYINATYRFGSGDLRKSEFMLSEDRLSLTMASTWSSVETHAAFMADPIVAANMTAMDSYNTDNNITVILGTL